MDRIVKDMRHVNVTSEDTLDHAQMETGTLPLCGTKIHIYITLCEDLKQVIDKPIQ